jgi:hypothetical protein
MKKMSGKRLTLAKETLRTLDNIALRGVDGADSGGSDSGSARCGSSDPRLASCATSCTGVEITITF